MSLTVNERISRAKIQIQNKNSFFAYLSLYLKFQEIEKGKMPMDTMGIAPDGHIFYVKEFIEEITKNGDTEVLEGVIAHEICLTPDSLILTEKGLKPISEIKVGEKVYSKGYFTEVKAISKRDYKGKMFKISSTFGIPLSFTPNHPILAIKQKNYKKDLGTLENLKRNRKPKNERFYKCEELNKNDGLPFQIPRFIAKRQKTLFRTRKHYKQHKVKLDKDIAYFLGYFVGDGTLGKNKKQGIWVKKENIGKKTEKIISICFHEKEPTKYLEKIVRKKFYRSPCLMKVKDKKAKRLVFSAKALATYLRKNFYDGKNKTIPSWLLFEKKEIIKSFIQGLEDSDGHTTTKGETSITSVYSGVYGFVPLLLLKLGLISSLKEQKFKKPRNPNWKIPYKISYVKNRKKEYSFFCGNKVITPIKKKEEFYYDGKVYNLETGTHQYSSYFMTIHNCHLVFLSELRTENRDRTGWNCSSDLSINTLLKNNGFKLPEGGMIPDHNDTFNLGKKVIKDVSKKTAEEIYDEFPKISSKNCKYVIASGSDKGKELGKIIDNHIKGKDGKPLTKKEKEGLIRDWNNKVQEAAIISKMKGDTPKGLDLLLGKLHEEKVDWRTMLNNHITNQIPYDYTWSKSSKRSVATGCYMPNQLKEKIEIVVLLDLSGSIGERELSDFLSEVIGMAKAYQERITMRILSHDTECYDCGLVANGNIEKLKSMKLKGGGGTSHVSSFEFIEENIKDCKCLVALTDGYSDLENIDFCKYRFEKIFVISDGGSDHSLKNKKCKVINLKNIQS